MHFFSGRLGELVNYLAGHPGPLQVVTLNGEMLHRAGREPAFLKLLRRPEVLCVADGVGVKLALRLDRKVNVDRIPGVELGWELALARPPVFLLGAKDEVVCQTAKRLKHAGARLAGFHHGYFKEGELPHLLEQIRASGARTLLVALGSPKQEFFIANHLAELPPLVAVGVGGSFDVWSGWVSREPRFLTRLGLEWFFRSLRPGRFHRLGRLAAFGWWVLSSRLTGQALFEDQVG